MPGYNFPRSIFKEQDQYDRLICVQCRLVMKDVVQPSCGHRLCQSCADEILRNDNPPLCPHQDCGEQFTDEDGAHYFPDRFIRKEIQNLEVACVFSNKGCNFEGKLNDLEAHLRICQYASYECDQCGKSIALDEMEKHKAECHAGQQCPLAKVGCNHKESMAKEDLDEHMSSNQVEHFTLIADRLLSLEATVKNNSHPPQPSTQKDIKKSTVKQPAKRRIASDFDEPDGEEVIDKGYHTLPDIVESDAPNAGLVERDSKQDMMLTRYVQPKQKQKFRLEVDDPYSGTHSDTIRNQLERKVHEEVGTELVKVRGDLQTFLMNELRAKTDEIASLRTTVSKLERSIRSKHAESEDRDFRLSLIENSNHDGTMIWKIPQIAQRMTDAQNGKYTSIFSLPFYTSRYGYKMCMRLYILGDGIGKGTHMSLFFVLMKGEFDNILQWPFTHKVTFKLINQAGGRDVSDTFQPDPMSSSFRKPRSDMNIASGCPRFVSLQELKNNGFIVDDTIFIKCIVDTTTIKLP